MRRAFTVMAFAAGAGAVAAAGPAPGRYDGQLCVATQPEAAPSCGAAEVEVRGARVDVRVADIVYRLALRSAQLDVATMHGRLRIDEFSADYTWASDVLAFRDAAKNVRYELRLRPGAPRR